MTAVVPGAPATLPTSHLAPTTPLAGEIPLHIDTTRPAYTMRGGIGASWHAVEREITGHAGSAWGGNPPASNENAWQQLYRHADFLGINWCRVEVEQRIYNPQRNIFEWDNPDMRALYRILDWCESRQADVFFQQMWGNVEWNAHPGVLTLKSAPRDVHAYAHGLAELLHHLVITKKYSCIKYLCIANEPGPEWAWWHGPEGPTKSDPLRPALQATREALDARNIPIPLAGPDWAGPFVEDLARIDFADLLGAYDIHTYNQHFAHEPLGQHALDRVLRAWSSRARAENKPFFLTEFGTMDFGWGTDRPEPGQFDASLRNVEIVLRGLAAGVDAFNRWSFTNRGDLDGQWQLVDTWNPLTKTFLEKIQPHPHSYAMFTLLSRFTAKHSDVLSVDQSAAVIEGKQHLFAGALRSPKGQLTLLLLNNSPHDLPVALHLTGLAQPTQFHLHDFHALSPAAPADTAPPTVTTHGSTLRTLLPGRSVCLLTTYDLSPLQPGIISETR